MKQIVILPLILFYFSLSGQSLHMPTKDEIPGLEMVQTDTYTSRNFDKVPGARVQLWMEYGLRNLNVSDYKMDDARVRLEVYLLEDAPSAYGLYSVSITECTLWNRFSFFSCANPNRISLALGPFYISATNIGNTGIGQSLCEELVRKIIDKNPQDTWNLPAVFQFSKLSPFLRSLKYIRGPEGMATGVPQIMRITDGLQYSCYSIKIVTNAYAGVLARFVFPDFNSLDRFMMNAGISMSGGTTPTPSSNGTYRSFYKIDDTKILFLECTSPEF